MNKDTENQQSEENEKNLEYAKSIVETMIDTPMTRGRRSGSMREFDKAISNMNNQQLIEISDFLGKLIEQTNDDELLGPLLDNVLENITGNLS